MPEIPIMVRNKIATYTGEIPYVCGNSDYTAVFTFDEEWNKHTQKTARFVYGSFYTDVLFEGDECPFPVIEEATLVVVGVFAGNLRTSTGASVRACYSIRSCFGAPEDPEPNVYDQIMERLDELSQGGTGGGGTPDAVQFVPQKLTDKQQAQARENIGAARTYTLKDGETIDDAPEDADIVWDPDNEGEGSGGDVPDESLAEVHERLDELSEAITDKVRNFTTQAIGELFEPPLAYTGWCSGSLHFDQNIGKYVDLLYCAPKHEKPDYTANYIVYIDPKTYDATEPILCKYYDADGSTELSITMVGRPAFVILADKKYMMLLEVNSKIYRFISEDNGLTWVKGEEVNGYSGSSECYVLTRLSNGRILANAISRVINYSDDNGVTWKSVTPTTAGGSYEAEYCFLEVKSGVILGICRMSVQGVGRTTSGDAEHAVITVSEDYGTTWSDLKVSDTLDNMNASTCTGYVHNGVVEIFAASRWYNNGDYAVTDYTNTGKSGAITHYVATIENALNDKFTNLGVVVYAKTKNNTTDLAVTLAAQDFHTPCIAVNGEDMLMVYFDRVEPYNVADTVNHYYVRGSLNGIDYGVKDDLESTVFPYSSVQVKKLLRKQYNELVAKINEAISSLTPIPPEEDDNGAPSSYVIDGVIANFNFTDESKVNASAKTVTDTINGIVATCTDETFPAVRENSLGFAAYTVPAIETQYGGTTVDKGFTAEFGIYRYDGDEWRGYEFWYTQSASSGKYRLTCDSAQASHYTYIDTSGASKRTTMWWNDVAGGSPIPAGAVGFIHFVLTLGLDGVLTIYKNGEVFATINIDSFSSWDTSLIKMITGLCESMKTYRIYNRALTSQEVAINYQYELGTIV